MNFNDSFNLFFQDWRVGARVVAKWGPANKIYPAIVSRITSDSKFISSPSDFEDLEKHYFIRPISFTLFNYFVLKFIIKSSTCGAILKQFLLHMYCA